MVLLYIMGKHICKCYGASDQSVVFAQHPSVLGKYNENDFYKSK